MTIEQLRSAAQARGEQAPNRTARPRERRADQAGQVSGRGAERMAPVSCRSTIQLRGLDDLGGPLVFDGFASVTGRAYEMWDMFGPYTEQIHVGAFAETLAQDGLDVPLVIDHVSSRRIARTGNSASPLMLSEVVAGDRTGLHVLAPTLDRQDPDTAYIAPKLRSGLIDEMSFRFMITSGRWNEDWDEYHIYAVDIHRGDVSIVGYGANPHTAGSGLRSAGKTAARGIVRRELRRIATSRTLTGPDATAVTALLMQLAAADATLDPIVEALGATDLDDQAPATLAGLLALPEPTAAAGAAVADLSQAREALARYKA